MKKYIFPPKHCNLCFDKTVNTWDEAVPLGNGNIGALIWGHANELRFSMDAANLWDKTPFEGIYSPEFTYKNMVALAKTGRIDEIRRIFDAPYNNVTPTKLPAGRLILNLKQNEGTNVKSELDISSALAEITAGAIKLESFIHAQQKLCVIKINAKLSAFELNIENPEYSIGDEQNTAAADSLNTQGLKSLFYPKPRLCKSKGLQYFVQKVSGGFSYGIFAGLREINGESLICCTVASSDDGEEFERSACEYIEKMLENSWQDLLKSHVSWWRGYWRQSAVRLPDKLFEKNWYLTNYLFASCSRKGGFPMPLQGVWTADNGALPPWKGDYHHDLNTQMSYYHYLKANHLPEGECFLDFLWSLLPQAGSFAKSFYNAKGICLPSVMTIDAKPLGGWGMYALSPTNQLWLAHAFERYYRISGKISFLKRRTYPYMKKSAEFIMSLFQYKNGKFYLPVSSSPEIHDDSLESFLTPNSNYDLSLIIRLFKSLAEFAALLGYENDVSNWQEVLRRLPALAVNEKNVLMLSRDEALNESHRHMSHLMAIHPLRLIGSDTAEGKKIIDACIEDIERLGTGGWTGYTFAWFAEILAAAKNGEGAAKQLETFWQCFCSQNGFHLNGDYKRRGVSSMHYRPFTLEGNMCAADALQEMLLYSENGICELFPAIPKAWEKDISFSSLRAENGVTVSAHMKDGIIVSLEISNALQSTFKLAEIAALQKIKDKYQLKADGGCFVFSSKALLFNL